MSGLIRVAVREVVETYGVAQFVWALGGSRRLSVVGLLGLSAGAAAFGWALYVLALGGRR